MHESHEQNRDKPLQGNLTSLNHAESHNPKEVVTSSENVIGNSPDLNSHSTPTDVAVKEPLPSQVAN